MMGNWIPVSAGEAWDVGAAGSLEKLEEWEQYVFDTGLGRNVLLYFFSSSSSSFFFIETKSQVAQAGLKLDA